MIQSLKQFKTSFFLLSLMTLSLCANATDFTAVSNGNFSSSATWLGGADPSTLLTTADNIIINTGVTVNLDIDVTINNASATIVLNGALSGAHNLTLQSGTLSGAGALVVHNYTVSAAGVSTFTGSTTADNLYNSAAALTLSAKTYITDTLGLILGTVTTAAGDTLTMLANSVVHVANGTFVAGTAVIRELGTVNLLYTGTGTVSTGSEVAFPFINNVTVNLSSNSNQLSLSGNVTVTGALNVQSGSLSINGHTLTLNGTVATSATGTLSGSLTSDISLGGSGSMGTLMFTSGSNTINNLTVNGSAASYATLGSDLIVGGMLTLTNGGINLAGSSNLTLTGIDSIVGGSANSYVATTGTGKLIINIIGGVLNNARMLPIGTAAGYAPVKVTNNGIAAGNFMASVHPGIYANGTTGSDLSATYRSVNTSWEVSSDITTGANVTLETYWMTAMGVNSFNTSSVYLSHYTNGAWDDTTAAQATAHAGGMFSVSRSGITSFSPFAVFSNNPAGIAQVSAADAFSAYPNPAMNVLQVSITNPQATNELKVYDLLGNRVADYSVHGASNTIDISALTSGVYFLSVNNTATQKFVKQ